MQCRIHIVTAHTGADSHQLATSLDIPTASSCPSYRPGLSGCSPVFCFSDTDRTSINKLLQVIYGTLAALHRAETLDPIFVRF